MNTETKQRNSVILVHGINDTGQVFQTMATYLREKKWSVYTLDLIPNNGDFGLEKLAHQIADYIADRFAAEEPLDIVGFSMGGIISRYYVQRLGGINRVQRFITISSPHNGTAIAYASLRLGCVQMRPNSAFLQDLNRDVAMLKQLNFTSIWTPYDLMIVPADSSRLPLGTEVIVPSRLHPWMLTDTRCLAAVAEALSRTAINSDRQSGHIQDFQKSLLGNGNI